MYVRSYAITGTIALPLAQGTGFRAQRMCNTIGRAKFRSFGGRKTGTSTN